MTDNGQIDEPQGPGSELGCPVCGADKIQTTPTEDRFHYGVGADVVQLVAVVPVRTCSACGYQFLDDEAETIRHETVCRHLGVLTPAEIVGLREKYGLSRTEFARLTQLGETALGKWERGALIQNAAYDRFLRLLAFEENLRRLRERTERAPAATPG